MRVRCRQWKHQTLLHHALSNHLCSVAVCEFLCQLKPLWITVRDNWKAYPLHFLCSSGLDVQPDVIKGWRRLGGARRANGVLATQRCVLLAAPPVPSCRPNTATAAGHRWRVWRARCWA